MTNDFDWALNDPIQRLGAIARLEDGWGGPDTLAFSDNQLVNCRHLVERVQAVCLEKGVEFENFSPFISPATDGTILLEWAGARFREFNRELHIFTQKRYVHHEYEFLRVIEERHDEGRCSLEKCIELFKWFLGQGEN